MPQQLMRVVIVIGFAAGVAGCDKPAPPPPRPELIETVRDFADRVCDCNNDRDCVEAIRNEWDAVKADTQRHGLVGEDKATFDAELLRLRSCGDAAGLTIWL